MASTRPETLDQPFTRWSLRKLVAYLAANPDRRVVIGRERLRQFLDQHQVMFQRAKTWKESNDQARAAKLARIEHVTAAFPDRVFAFDEFGPLAIRPHPGAGWAPKGHPARQPANYHKLHGVRQFHGCYSVGGDTLWGIVREKKSAANTLAALKSIRAARPDGAPIYIIMDNLSAHRGDKFRTWAAKNTSCAPPEATCGFPPVTFSPSGPPYTPGEIPLQAVMTLYSREVDQLGDDTPSRLKILVNAIW